MPNPVLETLMLAFKGDNAFAEPGRALFMGAQPHPALKAWPEVMGWQPHRPKATGWDNDRFSRCDELPVEGKWPLVLQLLGKSRDEVLAGFSQGWERLEPGGMLVTAMQNNSGAGRFEKELRKAVGEVFSIQKNKCRVFGARKEAGLELPIEWVQAGERRKIPDTEFITEAGVFSAGRIDPGSLMLAENLPSSLNGKIADLGAGWGYLSDVVLRNCPRVTKVDLFEADSRALNCARLNLAAHESKAAFHWCDVTKGLPNRYDAIVMNPPFHSGKATDLELGRAFLKAAGAGLHQGGELWMVANRHLPYEAVLGECGFRWRQVASDATYKVISATR
jgi:16S rRNA (guanine1207-N2)-methyltransferase